MSTQRHEPSNLAGQAGSLIAGMLMGALIGSGTMLLLAPRSGKKTRAKLQQEGIELRDQVVETVEGVVEQVRDTAHQVAAQVNKQSIELRQRGQDAVDEQMEVVSDVIEAEQKAAHHIVKG